MGTVKKNTETLLNKIGKYGLDDELLENLTEGEEAVYKILINPDTAHIIEDSMGEKINLNDYLDKSYSDDDSYDSGSDDSSEDDSDSSEDDSDISEEKSKYRKWCDTEIICDCLLPIKKGSLRHHRRSRKHINRLKSLKKKYSSKELLRKKLDIEDVIKGEHYRTKRF